MDEFIDIDPYLKSLRSGYLMQITYYYTKLATGADAQSAKAGTSPIGRKSDLSLSLCQDRPGPFGNLERSDDNIAER